MSKQQTTEQTEAGKRPIPDTPGQPTPTPEPDLPPGPAPDPNPAPRPIPPGGSRGPEPSDLPPAAQRALAEAEARRREAREMDLPPELGGRDGPEPVRYGDWEKKGIAIDF